MEEINLITYQGKVIAHHYWTEEGNWLIVWDKHLEKDLKDICLKELMEQAKRLEINLEFKTKNE